jgi:hypothetical protein
MHAIARDITRIPAALPSARRRGLLAAAAAAAALVPLRQAVAQAAAGGGDWLAMVRQHHDLLDRSFKELLSPNDQPWERRRLQLRTVNQLINAHSLAEEAVVYPALARAGMRAEAEQMYMAEAHVKMAKSHLQAMLRQKQSDAGWRGQARELRDMVLRHAREDEEKRLFAQLHRQLGADGNRALGDLYAEQFAAVQPRRPR